MLKYFLSLLILFQGEAWAMKFTSKDFVNEGPIPQIFTCEGEDISPELNWSDVPAKAQSLVMICDDPDAPMGVWDHWLVFNLPPISTGLKKAITEKEYPAGTGLGRNSWGRNNYGGPCPPSNVHRYYFRLYALDTKLDLANGATKPQILKAMEGHILAQAELMGKYQLVHKPI